MCAAPDGPRAGGAGLQVTLKSGVRFEHSRNRNRGRVQPRSTSSGAKTRTRGPAAKFCREEGFSSSPLRARLSQACQPTQYTVHSEHVFQRCRSASISPTITSPSPTATACDSPGVCGVWGLGIWGSPSRPLWSPRKSSDAENASCWGPAVHHRLVWEIPRGSHSQHLIHRGTECLLPSLLSSGAAPRHLLFYVTQQR